MSPSLTDDPVPSLSESLASLNIFWILAIVIGVTLLRLILVRSPVRRSALEFLESALIAVPLVFLIIRPFFLQAFYIPSASMEPTLLGNKSAKDRILVNKLGYRLQSPQREDVVVFLAPPAAMPGDKAFVKRLIGLPGDRVEVVGGFVRIGAKMFKHAELRRVLAQAGVYGPEARAAGDVTQADHHLKLVPGGALADEKLISKERLAQILTGLPHANLRVQPGVTMRNGITLNEPFIAEDPDYDFKFVRGEPLKHDYAPPVPGLEYRRMLTEDEADTKPLSAHQYEKEAKLPTEPLPAKYYLMMGDNRNDSNDSTNWGLLEARRVVGRAQVIFWPPTHWGVVRP